MEQYFLISETAKEVEVESHVLRYWEEELHLPIRRNEQGHRYYTREDVELFKQIKRMKEKGLQLKAIKMVLKDGKLDIVEGIEEKEMVEGKLEIPQVSYELSTEEESREEKARRLQCLLQQLIRETLRENNKALCEEIRESVLKELDYQFRIQEENHEDRERRLAQVQAERDREREKKEREREKREEQYYRKLDKLLRSKSTHLRNTYKAIEDTSVEKGMEEDSAVEGVTEEVTNIVREGIVDKKEKKKRHFIF